MLRTPTTALALLGALTLLPACGRHVIDPSTVDGVLNCDTIALRGEDGVVDDCDRKACEACVDFCGIDCAVMESYPPQYSCPSIGAYTVRDFCPDWGAEPEDSEAEPTGTETETESPVEEAPEAEEP